MHPRQDEHTPSPAAGPGSALLGALRRAARPDRARVTAYVGLARRPAGWASYAQFLSVHRAWIAALDRALSQAGPAAAPARPAGMSRPHPDRAPDGAGPPTPAIAPPQDLAQALGYLYVLESFRLGCAVLARRTGAGAEAHAAGQAWGELARALERVPPADHPQVVESARRAFASWEAWLRTSPEAEPAAAAFAGG